MTAKGTHGLVACLCAMRPAEACGLSMLPGRHQPCAEWPSPVCRSRLPVKRVLQMRQWRGLLEQHGQPWVMQSSRSASETFQLRCRPGSSIPSPSSPRDRSSGQSSCVSFTGSSFCSSCPVCPVAEVGTARACQDPCLSSAHGATTIVCTAAAGAAAAHSSQPPGEQWQGPQPSGGHPQQQPAAGQWQASRT